MSSAGFESSSAATGSKVEHQTYILRYPAKSDLGYLGLSPSQVGLDIAEQAKLASAMIQLKRQRADVSLYSDQHLLAFLLLQTNYVLINQEWRVVFEDEFKKRLEDYLARNEIAIFESFLTRWVWTYFKYNSNREISKTALPLLQDQIAEAVR